MENNECDVATYDHDILKPERVHELIERVKKRSAGAKHPLHAGTSYKGGAIPKPNVVKASDFLLLHGNGVKEPKRITEMLQQTRKVDGYPMSVAPPLRTYRRAAASPERHSWISSRGPPTA